MAMKYSIFVFILVSLIAGLKGCPNIDGCSFDNNDCTSLTCKSTDFGQTVFLNIKLNTCEKDVTVTINIIEYSLGVDFTYTFTANEEIPIPGLNFGPLGSANIQVKITREDKHLKLGIYLVIKLLSSSKSVKIMNEDLGVLRRSIDCGFQEWLDDQPAGIKAAVIGGMILFVLSVIGCIVCCCRCCCRNRSAGLVIVSAQQQQPKEMAPYPVTSSVPYDKF